MDSSILTTLNLVSLGIPKVIAKAMSAEHGVILEKLSYVLPLLNCSFIPSIWFTYICGSFIEYETKPGFRLVTWAIIDKSVAY